MRTAVVLVIAFAASANAMGNKPSTGYIANHIVNIAGVAQAVGGPHAAHKQPRSDEDLYARDFDEDLYARDFDEDLYVRELEDALYARGRQAHGRPKQLGLSHIASHITHIAGAAEAIGNAHAAFKQRRSDDDLWARSFDYYDELD
ncbi:hypothetical protein FOMPIDRAFT_1026001 [Fomitopsis schrenkii]|uniref:Uncharacterized protein n=1 Tax=Fomitopsis schrenkii TaxID=2126942 RepID=S8DND5_FOMSC|nr:hypothetical protein FOMPIDRAFT_1026001 [Fomitopsis schrenkii]